MRILAVAVTVLLLGAGCLSNDPDQGTPVAPGGSGGPDLTARVVVAVIDTAINPYHDHFQRNESLPDHVLESFVDVDTGATPQRIQLSQEGDFEERREADADFWDNIESGQTYYFEGTRVMGISFGGNLIDGGSHGTAVVGAVLDANPDANVILVQGFSSEAWPAAQPWIDFMSESYGPLGSPPAWLILGSNTANANKAKWDQGGIPVGAADNTPALAPIDSTAGPPWVVGVAGDHPDGCREHLSANLPDFTGHFTQRLPRDRSIDEYGSTSGTSFSTPQVAGAFSRVLLEVRQAWGHTEGIVDGALAIGPDGQRLTNVGLRDAFNRTATYPDFLACGGPTPVNPVAPWLQMGWGHAGPTTIQAAVEHILGVQEAPAKPDEAVAYMEAIYQQRETMWGLAPGV